MIFDTCKLSYNSSNSYYIYVNFSGLFKKPSSAAENTKKVNWTERVTEQAAGNIRDFVMIHLIWYFLLC